MGSRLAGSWHNLFTVHASPSFWEFAFQKDSDRRIRIVNSFEAGEYGARTCVRMAFKAYELGLKYSFGSIDPTKGTLAASHKEKFDKMANWVDSPFHEYKCNTCRKRVSPTVTVKSYVLKKRHDRVKCIDCMAAWANIQCSHKRCKKCCIKFTTEGTGDVCKVKTHHQ